MLYKKYIFRDFFYTRYINDKICLLMYYSRHSLIIKPKYLKQTRSRKIESFLLLPNLTIVK